MKRAAFAVPGDLDTPTGGYAYDKRIIAELRALGWQVSYVEARSLSQSYPDRFEGDDLYYGRYIFTLGLERFATNPLEILGLRSGDNTFDHIAHQCQRDADRGNDLGVPGYLVTKAGAAGCVRD